MEEKCMAVAFTGHRPETIPYIIDTDSDQYFHLEKVIWQEVHKYINAGYTTFYCGAARGADMLCGEIILSEKETKHPELKLVCAIPFKEQARGWDYMERIQYRELLRRADRIVRVCDSYQRGCYLKAPRTYFGADQRTRCLQQVPSERNRTKAARETGFRL